MEMAWYTRGSGNGFNNSNSLIIIIVIIIIIARQAPLHLVTQGTIFDAFFFYMNSTEGMVFLQPLIFYPFFINSYNDERERERERVSRVSLLIAATTVTSDIEVAKVFLPSWNRAHLMMMMMMM